VSTAKVGSIELYYEEQGSGDPLLLIMGLAADSRAWLFQVPDFARRYRTITFDNRGVGRSSKPAGPYTIHEMADDAAGLLETFDIARAHVVGVSMGGMIAQELALRHPRRIVQLLLALTTVMLLATLLFALADVLWLALSAVWMTRWMRIATRPLVVVWVNRGLAPGVRATVLSMLGQAEALGEICGGPLLGLVGTLYTVHTALVGAAVVLLPALPLYGRVLCHNTQGEDEVQITDFSDT